EVLIQSDGLALGYGGSLAVEGVSFSLAVGGRLALLGPTGGGSTTILRALRGELAPLAGSLRVGAPCGSVPQTDRSRLDYTVSGLEEGTRGALAGLPGWGRPRRA